MARPDVSHNDPTAAYAGFEGTVNETFGVSESWWPPRRRPSAEAPNVVVILVDDLGYSDLGCYGSEISTPNIDALAARGLRYTNFHSTPMCSPTRAALLTGVNAHAAGVGHVAHSDPGFPGYAMELSPHTATMAEIFGDAGYATMMVGKWHLAKDSDLSAAGDRRSWPVQRGFEQYYGILDGFTNFHQPHRLVSGNDAVDLDAYPDDYYFTDDITDRAIAMMREAKASNPNKPFLMYVAHGAVHAPLQAKAADIEAHRGRYDIGWDALRDERFERLVELGIIDADTRLPTRNAEAGHEVVAWTSLEPQQRELFSHYMSVYAAMLDNLDQNVGRLLQSIDQMGQTDNTIVILTSDNGASREGEDWGTSSYFTHLIGTPNWQDDYARLDEIGGPTTMPHVPQGWAMASNTPFRLYKINTHAGGHQVPFIMAGPGTGDVGGDLRRQYTYVTDVLPTLSELCGVDIPTVRGGLELKAPSGTSFVPTLGDAAAPSRHTEQYYEMWGHRGFYRDGWEIVTVHQPWQAFGDHEWELYHLAEDPTECHDRASERPDKVAELAAAWEEAAWENQVYPLEDGTMLKHIVRPPETSDLDGPVTIVAGTPTLERWRSQRLVWVRAFRATVDLEHRSGNTGVLFAHGDQGGGYSLYVNDGGHLIFAHNDGHMTRRVDAGPLPDGATAVVLDATAPGANVWNVTIEVDGAEAARAEGFDMFLAMAPFEGIDVGIDRRSPVDWEVFERHGPFPYSGVIHSVRYEPGEHAPDAPVKMIDTLRELSAAFSRRFD